MKRSGFISRGILTAAFIVLLSVGMAQSRAVKDCSCDRYQRKAVKEFRKLNKTEKVKPVKRTFHFVRSSGSKAWSARRVPKLKGIMRCATFRK